MNSGRRIFGVAMLIDILAFCCFFAVSVASFSANEIVPAFALKWEAAEAFHGFLGVLAGLQFLGLAVALGSSKGKSGELVQGSILPTVILSSILAATALIGGPNVEGARSGMRSASAAFGSSLASARAGLESGDLARARTELAVCQAISRKDPRLTEVESRLSAAEVKAIKDKIPQSAPKPVLPRDPVAAKEYYLKALAYNEKGDFFYANQYAMTAVQLDPSYTDARRLAATSWEELHARGADPADKERSAFYSRKLEGYGLLRSGDPVGAYRVFKGLADEKRDDKKPYADDPDVRRYLAESLTEMEKAAFFKDEADGALADALVPDILFRVPDPVEAAKKGAKEAAKGGPLRMVGAKDAAWAGGAIYFREFEYLEAGPSGPRALVRSPYAKLTDGKVFLVCVERDRPANVYKPVWAAGPVSGPASLVELPISAESAYRALASRVEPSTLPLAGLWKAVGDSKAYGIDSKPIIGELVARSALPFGIFTAAALGGLLGGRFRRRGGGFPRGLYALVPLMAAALVPVFIVVGRLDALISAWSVKLQPGTSSLLLSAGIRTVVLFLAVLLMAGARDADGDID
jgi:tetratricopeptide (TPR) repeat protein